MMLRVITCGAWLAFVASIARTPVAAAPSAKLQIRQVEYSTDSDEQDDYSADGQTDENEVIPVVRLPAADGLLHFYVLPVGLGSCHVIQCPNGDLSVVDMGTFEDESVGLWAREEIESFLDGQFDSIKNVIVTHNHEDHGNLLQIVLTPDRVTSLKNIYLTCTPNVSYDGDMYEFDNPYAINDWLNSIQGQDKVRLINGGQACGPNGVPCGYIDICPSNPDVTAKILAANLGGCGGSNADLDSIEFKLAYNNVSVMFNSLMDNTADPNEEGLLKAMVDYYGPELSVTVSGISRHGDSRATKSVYAAAQSPKAIFVTANPRHSLHLLQCSTIDAFATELGSLCKPLETDPSSEDFCSAHPRQSITEEMKHQTTHTCGKTLHRGDGHRTVTDNDFAIFTTVPEPSTMNIIEFTTDGVLWGFVNHFQPNTQSQD